MLRLSREKTILTMAPDNEPVASARAGDSVIFETYDCFSNALQSETDRFASVGWERINPATGPLYIEGAEVGDVLRVHILDIRLDAQGVMVAIPGLGVLGDCIHEEKIKIVPLVDGKAVFNERLSLPLSPMIGVIGTAPAQESISTGTPGGHGGNMDCKRIGVGSTVYLPVAVPGALLAMGDLHALMGDGEIVVCGVEVSGEVTVRVDILRGEQLPLPMVQNRETLMTLASAETLDEAARLATRAMFRFLCSRSSLEAHEAGMLLSAAGDLRICQIVDPLMTARMEIPLSVLEKLDIPLPPL